MRRLNLGRKVRQPQSLRVWQTLCRPLNGLYRLSDQ